MADLLKPVTTWRNCSSFAIRDLWAAAGTVVFPQGSGAPGHLFDEDVQPNVIYVVKRRLGLSVISVMALAQAM
jgi:hypothetical protein